MPEADGAARAPGSSAVPRGSVVERGPPSTLRYLRYDTVLGKGAFKTVYKGFDEREGIEVAWNQIKSNDFVNEGQKLTQEIAVLKSMKHVNVMCFYDSWIDKESGTVNFITELFTSGTLRQYRMRHKNISLNAIKRWAWQILQGLVYLHGHNPPIIHRDLKCDNIFVNGSAGVVKIGDLGLATLLRGSTVPQSCTGTPEFMAPELYDERYDEKVDVYGFGMCMLELATMQYPYSECVNAAQIYKRVSQGRLPEGLKAVEDDELRKFIELCISHAPTARPHARRLLKHSFFEEIRKNSEKERELEKENGNRSPRDSSPAGSVTSPPLPSISDGSEVLENGFVLELGPSTGRVTAHASEESQLSQGADQSLQQGRLGGMSYAAAVTGGVTQDSLPTQEGSLPSGGISSHSVMEQVAVRAAPAEPGSSTRISMEVVNLPQKEGGTCNIEFSFELGVDNVQDIIQEMQSELNLDLVEEEVSIIYQKIDEELKRVQGDLQEPQEGHGASSFQFSPIRIESGNGIIGNGQTPVHFFQNASGSAFESSQAMGAFAFRTSGGRSSGEDIPVSSEGTRVPSADPPVAPQTSAKEGENPEAQNGAENAWDLSKSPSFLEVKEPANGEQPTGSKYVDFSELRKRFEEADAIGILRNGS